MFVESTMWCPPVISCFTNPINYSYIFAYNKPQLLDLQTNLANSKTGGPHCRKYEIHRELIVSQQETLDFPAGSCQPCVPEFQKLGEPHTGQG